MSFTVAFYAHNEDGLPQLQGVCNYDCDDGLDVQAVLKDLSDELLEKNTEEGFSPFNAVTGSILSFHYTIGLDKDLNRVINWLMKVCHWRLYAFHQAKHPYYPDE